MRSRGRTTETMKIIERLSRLDAPPGASSRSATGDNEDDYPKPFSAVGTIGRLHHVGQPTGSNNHPVLLAREGGDEFHVARSRSPCAATPEKAGLAMRAIDRRLRRLEESFAPQENEEVGRLVTLLRERRRRRAEQAGERLELRPCEPFSDDQNRPLSVADVLRIGRRRGSAGASARHS